MSCVSLLCCAFKTAVNLFWLQGKYRNKTKLIIEGNNLHLIVFVWRNFCEKRVKFFFSPLRHKEKLRGRRKVGGGASSPRGNSPMTSFVLRGHEWGPRTGLSGQEEAREERL